MFASAFLSCDMSLYAVTAWAMPGLLSKTCYSIGPWVVYLTNTRLVIVIVPNTAKFTRSEIAIRQTRFSAKTACDIEYNCRIINLQLRLILWTIPQTTSLPKSHPLIIVFENPQTSHPQQTITTLPSKSVVDVTQSYCFKS